MNEGKESFLHQELSVKDDQFGAGRNEIVTLVEPEELDENLILVLCKNNKHHNVSTRLLHTHKSKTKQSSFVNAMSCVE